MDNLIHSPEYAGQLVKMQKMLQKALKNYDYTEPPYKYVAPTAAK
jgi:hypothetical protein